MSDDKALLGGATFVALGVMWLVANSYKEDAINGYKQVKTSEAVIEYQQRELERYRGKEEGFDKGFIYGSAKRGDGRRKDDDE